MPCEHWSTLTSNWSGLGRLPWMGRPMSDDELKDWVDEQFDLMYDPE